jgi:histidinol phosphatase-like PHP family hydrolase
MPDRIDLHTHTFFSDGELLPSELVHRAVTLGYAAIALTDHADASNLEQILKQLKQFLFEQANDFPLTVIPGVELTHVPPARIAPLAKRAKELGAGLVVVHGETIVEPVEAGTNHAAVECAEVDILAHPGFITVDEARIAAQNNVALEISARKGHSLTNGHVAIVARVTGAKMIVNTDTHSPNDMIDQAFARAVARGAGLNDAEIEMATVTNPRALVERAKNRNT